mmetsp:Transcript_7234/g.15774  ORF Transcript_7234/g.15774 Transcript_7234/m.15774 type:complete len:488 (-) Transcript_7234:125-1588(-)
MDSTGTGTGTAGTGTGSVSRMITHTVASEQVDFMVVSYECHDAAVLTGFGSHSKVTKWQILAGLNSQAINITLTVDKNPISGAKVGVECNENQVFPGPGSKTGTLKKDFTWTYPFRCVLKGIGQRDLYEFRPRIFENEWFKGTVISQRSDGNFEALVDMPGDGGKVRKTTIPLLKQEQIREANTKKPIVVPKSELVLQVPASDPLKGTLTVDGTDLLTSYFARPTPCRMRKEPGSEVFSMLSENPELTLKVDKNRESVSVPGGHTLLQDWLTGEAKLVEQSGDRSRRSWKIELGPYGQSAVHEVVIEKKWKKSKIVTLSIDGMPLVEAAAEDFRHRVASAGWTCDFRFVGEKILSFQVHETDSNGRPFDSTDTISRRIKYAHSCQVSLENLSDFSDASLRVDGRNFRELRPRSDTDFHEKPLIITPQVLYSSYDIEVPYKTREGTVHGGLGGLGLGTVGQKMGFLFWCCAAGSEDRGKEIVAGVETT